MGAKERLYNYLSRLTLQKIPLDQVNHYIELIIDKSKAKPEIVDFNNYIIRHLQSKIDPRVQLCCNHHRSHENRGLQEVDLFCWGIFRKYEKLDTEWYDFFKDHIKFETVYLP